MKRETLRYPRALRLLIVCTLAVGGAVSLGACEGESDDDRARTPAAGETPAARADEPTPRADSAHAPTARRDTTESVSTAPPAPPATGSEGSAAGATPGPRTVEPPEPVPTETPVAAAERVPEILRATSRAYEALDAFRAEFEQELHNTLLGRTTRSRGTIFQRRPDRFLMRFSDPAGDRIVSDGDHFWMYYPSVDSMQVLRTPRGGQGLDLQSQFIGDPVQRFETTNHGTEQVRGRTAYVLTLDPREPAGYRTLKVWIDARDHLVRRFELTESNGNVRHFELHDLERNPTLPDDLFEFTPPPGAQVVTRG